MTRKLLSAVLATILCAACGAKEEPRRAAQPCVDRSEAVEGELDNPELLNWSPAWSPDGRQLAFSSSRAGDDGIYLIAPETCEVLRVTQGIRPAWSPDGKRLVIEREVAVGGPYRISVVGVDGHGLRQITIGDAKHPSNDGSPDWSSTGRIVFARDVDADGEIEGASETEVVSVRPDGTDLQVLAHGKTGGSPAWSPDGRRIALVCEDGLAVCVMRADGSRNRVVIRAEQDVQEVEWSPDGQTIVFSGNGEDGGLTLFHAPARGGEPTLLSHAADNGDHPTWSPDGRWIAFAQGTELGTDLYLIRPDGTDIRRLTEPSFEGTETKPGP